MSREEFQRESRIGANPMYGLVYGVKRSRRSLRNVLGKDIYPIKEVSRRAIFWSSSMKGVAERWT